MSQPTLDAFQVIADPGRRYMLKLLSKKSLTINELAENFEMSRPAVSKHINIMERSGFITIQGIGRERHCLLKKDGFKEVQKWISYFDNFWEVKLQRLQTLLDKKAQA